MELTLPTDATSRGYVSLQSIIHYSAWHRLTFRESIADWVFPMLFDKEKNRFLPNPDCVDAITTALCEEKQERSAAVMLHSHPRQSRLHTTPCDT